MDQSLDRSRTRCCASRAREVKGSTHFRVVRCVACGTLWASEHRERNLGFWDDSLVPERYADALLMRRALQAPQVLDSLRETGAAAPFLDYGSGQGVLLESLVAANVEAWGCDFYPNAPLGFAPDDRFLVLRRPWEVPEGTWGTIIFLDVIEHHPDPIAFLRALECNHIVLKVPTATGPFARLARLAARFGNSSALDAMFQAGSPMPHRWLPTLEGLDAIAASGGWKRTWKTAMPEVGRELPDRLRISGGIWNPPVRLLISLAGSLAGGIGRFWSDTLLAVYERS